MNTKAGSRSEPDFGFVRVAAVSPEVVIGDLVVTARNIMTVATDYASKGAKIIVFPELCLAGGYTNADLFHQATLQNGVIEALETIRFKSGMYDAILIVGMPLSVNGALYNVAVVIDRSKIVGVVPKTYLPTGGEFQEARWFASAHDLLVKEVEILGAKVPFGTDLLFRSTENPDIVVGVEICEDVWTPLPPSSYAAIAGATILVNPSASNELVGKAAYRRELVKQQAARCIAAYVYSCAGAGESTTDAVFAGHNMIAENGTILAESERFGLGATGALADIDVELCVMNRMRTPSFAKCSHELRNRPYRFIDVKICTEVPARLIRPNPLAPFVPTAAAEKAGVCADVFNIQTTGLIQRLKKMGCKDVVLGLSGGLDSTLALMVCVKAFERLGLDLSGIHAYTMPGFGTTKETKSNAIALARVVGVSLETIPITDGVNQVLGDIGHDLTTQDVTYENAQARYRTLILMEKANQIGGIVIGTGDLSEAALGWCTYNGDHMSHYNVNTGVPKTLVRFVVEWVSEFAAPSPTDVVLKKILKTPISPELTRPTDGAITQKTEDIIGPYLLHDFFLFHLVRRGSGPKKILYLAKQSVGSMYTDEEIKKWLRVFIIRFFRNQFKRSSAPDGPKVGSVSLSQRGDWRMPSGRGKYFHALFY